MYSAATIETFLRQRDQPVERTFSVAEVKELIREGRVVDTEEIR